MTVYDLDSLLRDRGGLDRLPRELGQYGLTFVADEDEANENEPAPRSGIGV
jgi:hypothetical protein